MRRRWVALATGAALVLGACTSPTSETADRPTDQLTDLPDPADPAYDAALSEPVEDSVYPEVGDPGVDALHYDLDLTWDPDSRVLTGDEELVLRATEDDDFFQLDLAGELEVSAVTVDGREVDHEHRGKDLVVQAPVAADQRYTVRIRYAGEPGPVEAPTTRGDFAGLGWTVGDDGSVWTMQEPWGAYTWYAVNDQPADEALYDFTLRVADPMVGVANGELVSRESVEGTTVTEWSLTEPAASYVITVAFDDYVMTEQRAASGVPVSIWLPREGAARWSWLQQSTVDALDWAEQLLGAYPFDTLGFVFVDAQSGMETQTMVTLGLTEFTTSPPVQVHEVVHHWWGNQVTPEDWRDLWISEGMTTYLQKVWESEHGGPSLARSMAQIRTDAAAMREEAGPPGAYDQDAFAERNVYYLPALMWHQVRRRLGDELFFRLVREFPAAHDNENLGTEELVAWWERKSGEDLAGLVRRHLYAEQQPAR
ncbi:M1 family metallopeptidase [Nocardioides coralli]|uniref:M1 family metallopeptidase n=1 Tax=Nocardioides coralli TaxID=2872154 RepID=UPI001CA431BA|nr:M1 family metallopeptidase [Nocardioides coralli]QZY28976.1 M1 family metallopeptidase [Nocardioides coralli]